MSAYLFLYVCTKFITKRGGPGKKFGLTKALAGKGDIVGDAFGGGTGAARDGYPDGGT